MDITALTPYLAFIGALSAAVTGAGLLWRKVLGPALDNTLLRGIHDRVEGIENRISMEFANGVPPDDERYVPLRHYLERHVEDSVIRWEKHEREHGR